MAPLRVVNVVGARPNFMKLAPLHRALGDREAFHSLLVHTGQHYDERMSDLFFRQLELPRPDVHLGVGSGTHAEQTAGVMTAFERALGELRPDLVVVVGDVNSTLACSLVAAKAGIEVAHVEAGLRSFDRSMPEEINRMVTDRLSDWLFVTEESGVRNLRAEGAPEERVHLVGNVMIDCLVTFLEKARGRRAILERLRLEPDGFLLVTLHRPSNVDDPVRRARTVELLASLSELAPVVFPVHPRTRQRLGEGGQWEALAEIPDVHLLEPLGYLEFLCLMDAAGAVLTDSGGIQEETTYLGVPCLTLRENTERPVTVEIGTNRLVGLEDPPGTLRIVGEALSGGVEGRVPPLWDGRAAGRIVERLEEGRGASGAASAGG